MEQINLNKFIGQSETVVETRNIPTDFTVNHFSIDSRTIEKGDAFIAIKGERVDGHQYINQVLEKGASLVVMDQDFAVEKLPKQTPLLRVADTTRFLKEFSGWFVQAAKRLSVLLELIGENDHLQLGIGNGQGYRL